MGQKTFDAGGKEQENQVRNSGRLKGEPVPKSEWNQSLKGKNGKNKVKEIPADSVCAGEGEKSKDVGEETGRVGSGMDTEPTGESSREGSDEDEEMPADSACTGEGEKSKGVREETGRVGSGMDAEPPGESSREEICKRH
ncbi:MAG: uncharacterized protein A8A55_3133 [Amphiamblys sp. WSBS2006]|nr:MAG: uncharacterized protein A8A55_3133 [Amphiamblys sp. WSBS2006]